MTHKRQEIAKAQAQDEDWYTPSEIFADSIVHLTGLGLAVIGFTILLVNAAPEQNFAGMLSLGVYCLAALMVLAFSAIYNMDVFPSRREMMRRLDRAAIFLKIAGTYTPFAAINMTGAWAIGVLSAVWAVAALGAPIQLIAPDRMGRLAVPLYLAQGWLIVAAIGPLMEAVPAEAVALILTGGMLYTVGVVFYLWRSLPYQNAIWHVFVLMASGCMYAAVTISAFSV